MSASCFQQMDGMDSDEIMDLFHNMKIFTKMK